jgi:DNA-binding MarR family transcriptional regulator
MTELKEAIKQSKFESAHQKALLNIFYTSSWLGNQSADIFKEFQLTPQQYNVLRILRGSYPKCLCAGEVKEVMLDKSPDLTRLCDKLVEKGLIQRETNEQNRRQVHIKITREGLDLLAKIDPLVQKQHLEFKDRLSDKEAEQLSNLLDKLRG